MECNYKKAVWTIVNETLDKALEDWEDYEEALRICELVDAGHMKVYSLAEVESHLDELNALEGWFYWTGWQDIIKIHDDDESPRNLSQWCCCLSQAKLWIITYSCGSP